MNVYIPSRSRFVRSLTLDALTFGNVPVKRIWLAVPAGQVKQYERLAAQHNVSILACSKDGIAATRQTIGRHAAVQGHGTFLMLDDDLRWFYRKLSDGTRLHKFEPKHMMLMLRDVERALERYAHAAISARQGNNQLPMPYAINRRPLRALAYQTDEFLKLAHGRVAIMEDFDVTLQLMKKGFANCVISRYAQDQGQTQLPGGCSDYRTHALHEENVLKMERLHRPYIKLVDKENITGGEFGKRKEAIIYWKKAWESSQL